MDVDQMGVSCNATTRAALPHGSMCSLPGFGLLATTKSTQRKYRAAQADDIEPGTLQDSTSTFYLDNSNRPAQVLMLGLRAAIRLKIEAKFPKRSSVSSNLTHSDWV